jgi:hypothetical protein
MGRNESFVLTISPDLFYRWTWENALSEIIQNGVDEFRKTNNPFIVEHDGKETLTIANQFASLEKDALISGFSTKRNDPSMIGKFGIGLPAALSTFARLDFNVEIYTNTEIWKPSIVRDPGFNDAELTKINVRSRRENRKVAFEGVKVFISPITPEMWEIAQKRFLCLETSYPKVSTSMGEILTSSDQVGRVYTKGIYVKTVSEFGYGFNLFHLDIDMERKVVDDYTMKDQVGQVLREALLTKTDLVLDNVWNKLVTGSSEVSQVLPGSWNFQYPDVQEIVVKKFREQHKDAIPVASIAESLELGHLGKKGVIISDKNLRNMIQDKVGSASVFAAEYSKSWSKVFNLDELNPDEVSNFQKAIDLLTQAISPIVLTNSINVVEFNKKGLSGLFSDGNIYLSRSTLQHLNDIDSADGVLGVLVHEYAHNFGSDGDVSHVRAIEKTWSSIVKVLLSK